MEEDDSTATKKKRWPLDERQTAIVRGALLGAAVGLRSQIGLAAVAFGRNADRLPKFEQQVRVKRALIAVCVGEVLVDKLSFIPPRTRAAPLATRALLGAAAAAQAAHVRRQPVAPALVAGTIAAVVSAKLGHDIRAAALKRRPSKRLFPALVEDATAATLAAIAVWS